MDDGALILVSLVAIGLGIFVFILLIRLWFTLGDIRQSCQAFNMDSNSIKKQAIEMCERGSNIYRIARTLNISPKYVKELCLGILKQRAISYANDGNSTVMISSALHLSKEEVESWINEQRSNTPDHSNDEQDDKTPVSPADFMV